MGLEGTYLHISTHCTFQIRKECSEKEWWHLYTGTIVRTDWQLGRWISKSRWAKSLLALRLVIKQGSTSSCLSVTLYSTHSRLSHSFRNLMTRHAVTYLNPTWIKDSHLVRPNPGLNHRQTLLSLWQEQRGRIAASFFSVASTATKFS